MGQDELQGDLCPFRQKDRREALTWSGTSTRWPPGAVIADVYSLPLDPGLPPGRYTLQLGMQRFMTDWWLPIGKSGQRGDFLNLGEILYSY